MICCALPVEGALSLYAAAKPITMAIYENHRFGSVENMDYLKHWALTHNINPAPANNKIVYVSSANYSSHSIKGVIEFGENELEA